jgi:two-component system sensor histidine kinase QseC
MQQEYEKNLRYQVWNGEGVLLLRSANAPATPMTLRDAYSETADPQDRTWRHYAVWDQDRHFRIVVSEAHDLRNHLVRSIVWHVASPLALGLPVLIVLLWFSINRGLNPLGVLTREISRRKPDNLVPLDASSAPGEVRPMVLAANTTGSDTGPVACGAPCRQCHRAQTGSGATAAGGGKKLAPGRSTADTGAA